MAANDKTALLRLGRVASLLNRSAESFLVENPDTERVSRLLDLWTQIPDAADQKALLELVQDFVAERPVKPTP